MTQEFLVAMRPGETPVPIPNTTVKTRTADGTALETAWESRRPPDPFYQQTKSFVCFHIDWFIAQRRWKKSRPGRDTEKLSGSHQRACPSKEGQGQWFDSIVGHSAERLKTLYLENCIRVKSLINRESLN